MYHKCIAVLHTTHNIFPRTMYFLRSNNIERSRQLLMFTSFPILVLLALSCLLFLKFTIALYVFMLLSRGKGEVERSIIGTSIYIHKNRGLKQHSYNGRQGNKINFHLCLLLWDWHDVYQYTFEHYNLPPYFTMALIILSKPICVVTWSFFTWHWNWIPSSLSTWTR